MKYLLFLSTIACGTPVQGKWEALDTSISGVRFDLTQEFTDREIHTRTVGYSGSTPQYTTNFSGTYTWENQSDGTHVFVVYTGSRTSVTGANGQALPVISPTVCLTPVTCEGVQFQTSESSAAQCVCLEQELVFDIDGDEMTNVLGDATITYRRP